MRCTFLVVVIYFHGTTCYISQKVCLIFWVSVTSFRFDTSTAKQFYAVGIANSGAALFESVALGVGTADNSTLLKIFNFYHSLWEAIVIKYTQGSGS